MSSRVYYRNKSRILSRVMDDIGLNEDAVMSRRRAFLIRENLQTLEHQLLQINVRYYVFGSQTEGSTTYELESDVDLLIVFDDLNLIQRLNDWVPGRANLLMIQNEKFPGYCKLQLLKPYGPYPQDELPKDKHYIFDEDGRVILLNNVNENGVVRHGPAILIYSGEDSKPCDEVYGIRCKTWPNGYKMWSTNPRKGTWPTPEMISYMENSGCFVVPVAHRLDEKNSESWRISTSLAERRLMFSLNITQIRCYTLIKMIVKTFIDPVIPDVISSYICKNLLFHCVENTGPDFWQESNLIRCVNQILLIMLETVRCMNCPSYFNESINLLLGKVNKANQVKLMGVIWKVLVKEDNINESIHRFHDCSRDNKCNARHTFKPEARIYEWLGLTIQKLMIREVFSQGDLESLQNNLLLFALQGSYQYVSATLLFPFLCSHLATLQANEHILHGEMISTTTSFLYERSCVSDLTSSRLKYASYLYCTGQLERAFLVLIEINHRYVDGYHVICGCGNRKGDFNYHLNIYPSRLKDRLSPSNVSMCVMFSQAERRCCPRELQYEMYRSTEQEKLQRDKYEFQRWFDLACVTSWSYEPFLMYMTSRLLEHRGTQSHALRNLEKRTNVNMHHRETAYNMLGQCYEYEKRYNEAFACYCKSLRVRSTNNTARWHIVLLLYTIYQNY